MIEISKNPSEGDLAIKDNNLAENSNMMGKEIKAKIDAPIGVDESKPQAVLTAVELKDEKAGQNKVSESVLSQPLPQPDFDSIYNELHSKFPEIINLKKPVLLAVGIRKEMVNATGISGVILKRWIAWYFRKSQYYKEHKEGAKRYNLQGEEAGMVTDKHCLKMAKQLAKFKEYQESEPPKTMLNDSE